MLYSNYCRMLWCNYFAQLALTNPTTTIIERLDNSNFLSQLGFEWMFMTVGEVVQVCSLLIDQQGV